jgi:hypothetical protein
MLARTALLATLVALAAPGAASADAVLTALYPIAAERLSSDEVADVQALLETAVRTVSRRGALAPAAPFLLPRSCGVRPADACLARLAQGVVIVASAARRGAVAEVTAGLVDASGRRTAPVAFDLDLAIQSSRPAEAAVEALAARWSAPSVATGSAVPGGPSAGAVAAKPAPAPATAPSPAPAATPAEAPLRYKDEDGAATTGMRTPGFRIGARFAWAKGYGSIFEGSRALSDAVNPVVPVQIDLDWRLEPSWSLGFHGAWAYAGVEHCTDGVSCKANVARVGGQLAYFLPTGRRWEPWLGAAGGWEALRLIAEAGGEKAILTYSGFSRVALEGGIDLAIGGGPGAWGPYASCSFARYTKGKVSDGTDTVSGDLDAPTRHRWLELGVRGTFGTGGGR